MKDTYARRIEPLQEGGMPGLASIDVWRTPVREGKYKGAVIIARVKVTRKFRGRGYASALWKEVLRDADAEGITLLLSIQPDVDNGLDAEALIAWYKKLGFELVEGEGWGAMMRRQPRGHIKGS
jgi:GNAT superfamily N-acetyltransferase